MIYNDQNKTWEMEKQLVFDRMSHHVTETGT